jgi:DNA-binding transcriptional ArsR family regulator
MQASPPRTPAAAARGRSAFARALTRANEHGFFRALADPTRARILACLYACDRPCSVTELAECCDVDLSVVSRHLTALARAGLVTHERQSRTAWYTPDADAFAARLRELAAAAESCKADPDACCDSACSSCSQTP